jgi:hypothetical protein
MAVGREESKVLRSHGKGARPWSWWWLGVWGAADAHLHRTLQVPSQWRAAGPSLPWSSRPACRRIWWWSVQVLLILRQWGREARTLPRHTGCVLGSFCCCVASLGFTEVSFFTCPGTPASILRCVPLPPAPNPSGRPPSHLACCPASPFSTRAIREEATSCLHFLG